MDTISLMKEKIKELEKKQKNTFKLISVSLIAILGFVSDIISVIRNIRNKNYSLVLFFIFLTIFIAFSFCGFIISNKKIKKANKKIISTYNDIIKEVEKDRIKHEELKKELNVLKQNINTYKLSADEIKKTNLRIKEIEEEMDLITSNEYHLYYMISKFKVQ